MKIIVSEGNALRARADTVDLVLDKNSTDPKIRSQRCFGSVGAAEPRAVARKTFHKRNPTTFQSNTSRICKVPIQNTATARRDQFIGTRKQVFHPQGPASFARTIYHFSLDSGVQNTASVIFSVLFSEDKNTTLPDRKKRTYLNRVLDGIHDALRMDSTRCYSEF